MSHELTNVIWCHCLIIVGGVVWNDFNCGLAVVMCICFLMYRHMCLHKHTVLIVLDY